MNGCSSHSCKFCAPASRGTAANRSSHAYRTSGTRGGTATGGGGSTAGSKVTSTMARSRMRLMPRKPPGGVGAGRPMRVRRMESGVDGRASADPASCSLLRGEATLLRGCSGFGDGGALAPLRWGPVSRMPSTNASSSRAMAVRSAAEIRLCFRLTMCRRARNTRCCVRRRAVALASDSQTAGRTMCVATASHSASVAALTYIFRPGPRLASSIFAKQTPAVKGCANVWVCGVCAFVSVSERVCGPSPHRCTPGHRGWPGAAAGRRAPQTRHRGCERKMRRPGLPCQAACRESRAAADTRHRLCRTRARTSDPARRRCRAVWPSGSRTRGWHELSAPQTACGRRRRQQRPRSAQSESGAWAARAATRGRCGTCTRVSGSRRARPGRTAPARPQTWRHQHHHAALG
eukprot:m.71735 g.71735  ORF g.71735 m.71735 type:complete len:405 (+) comp7645_c0_seq4:1450-2664(+)